MSLQQLPNATTPAPAQPPLFSIATPARNALSNLRRCAGSVRGQQGAHWEHLVQDAGHGFAIADFVRSSWVSIIGSVLLVAAVWAIALVRWGQA